MNNAKYRVKKEVECVVRKSDPIETRIIPEGTIVTMLQCGPIDREPDSPIMGGQIVRLDNGLEISIEGTILELVEGTEGVEVVG